MGKWQVQLCKKEGFWKYPEKRRVNFDLKAGSVGGGHSTQQKLRASGALGILLWSFH